jgi:hypothetical protein
MSAGGPLTTRPQIDMHPLIGRKVTKKGIIAIINHQSFFLNGHFIKKGGAVGKSHETSSHEAGKKPKVNPPQIQNPTQEPLLFLQEEQGLAAAAGTASPEDRLANGLKNLPSDALRRRNLAAAQDLAGNTLAARTVQRLASAPSDLIQRHPPGSPLLGGTAAAPGGGGGGGGPAPTPAGAGVAGGGGAGGATPTGATPAGATPAGATPAGATPAGATPAGATPAGATPAGGGGAAAGPAAATPAATPGTTPATGGAGAAASGPSPTELSMPTLQTAYAQNALQRAYGGVAGRTMITGNITVVADMTALYREYDRIQIENHVVNRDTGVEWVYGDKLRWNDARGLRTNAFAYSGSIWIDATQTDPTATVHEMLHVNTAPGFLNMVGRAVNEGITQRLAVRAVQASGNSVVGSERTYVQEQRVVTALVGVIGEGNLVSAYFNDPNILVNTYNAVMGENTFAILKRTLNADTQEGYDAAVNLLKPPSIQQKISLINAALDWWVSDNDLNIIERIVSTCSASDKAKIAAAIQPRIITLTDLGQRMRLRIILNTI